MSDRLKSRMAHLDLPTRLAHFAECQLATVEDLEDRPRFPKCELERHREIAEAMVQACLDFYVQVPKGWGGFRYPRLAKLLSPAPSPETP